MEITATELKANLGQYLKQVRTEDIRISRNGKRVARLVSADGSSVDDITGILKGTGEGPLDRRSIREERLDEHTLPE